VYLVVSYEFLGIVFDPITNFSTLS
jgi:hypothetical protein